VKAYFKESESFLPSFLCLYSFSIFSGDSVTIPAGVTTIGMNAFKNCSSLTTVNYKGTQEQWGQISKNSGNEALTNATKNYGYTGE
jgi:hypothetical protein